MRFVIYRDKKKEFRWRLKANNGKIIADSGESYKRIKSCVRGIELVGSSKSAHVQWPKEKK